MPSRDVNVVTRLAEASWRRDKTLNLSFTELEEIICCVIWSLYCIFMLPFEKGGAYCFAHVGRYVGIP